MVSKNLFSAVALAAMAMISQSAAAQASAPATGATAAGTTAPVTREQRKAETAAANKAGQLAPAGQDAPSMAPPTARR